MTLAALSVEYRGSRRVRVHFTGALASGAFTTLSHYAVTAQDGGSNPLGIVAAFAIATDPNAVELAVDSDLLSGALYTTGLTSVPAADSSTFTGAIDARVGLELTNLANVEPETQDTDDVLYGRDLVWRNDYVEDASGDLLTTSGRQNWIGALWRRFTSTGIGWDPAYGAQADQQVDAPDAYTPAFGGTLVSQARLDGRTKQASVDIAPAPGDPNGFVFRVTATAKDGLDAKTIDVSAPA